MKNEFIPYEQALELKELFDKPYLGECFGEYRQWDGGKPYLQLYQDLDGCSTDPADYEYTTECIAPTYSQAFRWFREKCVFYVNMVEPDLFYFVVHLVNPIKEPTDLFISEPYKTYEEAELACLKKLIELSTQTTNP
jgi:hypothetical protein